MRSPGQLQCYWRRAGQPVSYSSRSPVTPGGVGPGTILLPRDLDNCATVTPGEVAPGTVLLPRDLDNCATVTPGEVAPGTVLLPRGLGTCATVTPPVILLPVLLFIPRDRVLVSPVNWENLHLC